MTKRAVTTPAERRGYFDALYAADPDPWRFETSAYEDAKYAATLAALPRPRYARALEVGCSIGVLTARLASRCDRLTGTDVAAAALARAAERCRGLPGVAFAHGAFPDDAPPGPFDLIVFSELLYYFSAARLEAVAARARALAAPGADLLLVHWLGPTPDYPLTGDDAAERFIALAAPWARVTLRRREDRDPSGRLEAGWRLDRLRAG